jgi:hypothetical protein
MKIWVVARKSKLNNEEQYLNTEGSWGTLNGFTKTFNGEWYANHHIKYNCTDEHYTYYGKAVPTILPHTGDMVTLDFKGIHISGEISAEWLGRINIVGMENFRFHTSDIVKVIAERRYVIKNNYFDKEEKEEHVSYYNSGHYMMVGDISYSTRYRLPEGATAGDFDYVDNNVEGTTCIIPVNQIENSYSLKVVKDYHPVTFETLDSE